MTGYQPERKALEIPLQEEAQLSRLKIFWTVYIEYRLSFAVGGANRQALFF
jgi:hypothetical protein